MFDIKSFIDANWNQVHIGDIVDHTDQLGNVDFSCLKVERITNTGTLITIYTDNGMTFHEPKRMILKQREKVSKKQELLRNKQRRMKLPTDRVKDDWIPLSRLYFEKKLEMKIMDSLTREAKIPSHLPKFEYLQDLTFFTEEEISSVSGIGINYINKLKETLNEYGLSFKQGEL